MSYVPTEVRASDPAFWMKKKPAAKTSTSVAPKPGSATAVAKPGARESTGETACRTMRDLTVSAGEAYVQPAQTGRGAEPFIGGPSFRLSGGRMTRFRVGVLGALGMMLALWSPGTPTQAQSPATAVQSVKITLAPASDKKGCQLQSPVPQTSGVYPGDTLVWHVENGCNVSARVSITLTPVGSAPEVSKAFKVVKGLSSETVASLNRSEITAQVALELPASTTYEYNYVVHPESPSGLPDIKGKIIMCRQPPCPAP